MNLYEMLTGLIGNEVIAVIIAAVLPLVFILTFTLVAVLLERKISAHMQDRLGPMRTGFHGIFQTIADMLKLLEKEDITPTGTDKWLYNLAPVIMFIGVYAAFAAIPFAGIFIGSSIEIGLFFIVAISSLSVVGILMAGWSSDNKYSLYGGIRSAAQMVSYEIPTSLVLLSVIMFTGTMNLQKISTMQTEYFWNWLIFGGPLSSHPYAIVAKVLLIPFMCAGFLMLFISTLAECNRAPFDIPEAESELISGYHTEYSGLKFAFFFLAEYASMFAVSAMIVSIFLGGYQSPFGYIGNVTGLKWLVPFEQIFWFSLKGVLLVSVQMWFRWTLPRLRVDQLMDTCWKYLIPYALVNLLVIGLISLI